MSKRRNKLGLPGGTEFCRTLLPSAYGTHSLSCTSQLLIKPSQGASPSLLKVDKAGRQEPEEVKAVRATRRETSILFFPESSQSKYQHNEKGKWYLCMIIKTALTCETPEKDFKDLKGSMDYSLRMSVLVDVFYWVMAMSHNFSIKIPYLLFHWFFNLVFYKRLKSNIFFSFIANLFVLFKL